MGGYAIEVEGLVKRFGRVYALRGLSFRVPRGETYGLLGPNGAGKTTTIRAIAGALRPTRGRVSVLGLDPSREPLRVKALVGVVPELPSLFPELTVRENLLFIARVYGIPSGEAERRMRELLEFMGLEAVASRRYGQLSKGLKRRADIAAALLHDPEVVLLDEPTGGLDVVAASRLRERLAALRRSGKTILLSTHNIGEAAELSDRLLVIYRGAKLVEGTPSMLRRALSARRITVYYRAGGSEVEASRLEEALQEALASYDPSGLRVAPGSVSVTVKRALDALWAIRETLESLGLKVEDVEVLPPSWEDVLLHHIEEAEEGGRTCRCGVGGSSAW